MTSTEGCASWITYLFNRRDLEPGGCGLCGIGTGMEKFILRPSFNTLDETLRHVVTIYCRELIDWLQQVAASFLRLSFPVDQLFRAYDGVPVGELSITELRVIERIVKTEPRWKSLIKAKPTRLIVRP